MALHTDDESGDILNAITEAIAELIKRRNREAFQRGVERGKLAERERQRQAIDEAIKPKVPRSTVGSD